MPINYRYNFCQILKFLLLGDVWNNTVCQINVRKHYIYTNLVKFYFCGKKGKDVLHLLL